MGWWESPGFFCFSASEMAHDNTEQLAGFDGIHRDLLMHELDELIKITDLYVTRKRMPRCPGK